MQYYVKSNEAQHAEQIFANSESKNISRKFMLREQLDTFEESLWEYN